MKMDRSEPYSDEDNSASDNAYVGLTKHAVDSKDKTKSGSSKMYRRKYGGSKEKDIGKTLKNYYKQEKKSPESRMKNPRNLTRMMQEHREHEKFGHRDLNATMAEITKRIPGYNKLKKETKVVKLEKIISYICHLERHIEILCKELDVDLEVKQLFLSPNIDDSKAKYPSSSRSSHLIEEHRRGKTYLNVNAVMNSEFQLDNGEKGLADTEKLLQRKLEEWKRKQCILSNHARKRGQNGEETASPHNFLSQNSNHASMKRDLSPKIYGMDMSNKKQRPNNYILDSNSFSKVSEISGYNCHNQHWRNLKNQVDRNIPHNIELQKWQQDEIENVINDVEDNQNKCFRNDPFLSDASTKSHHTYVYHSDTAANQTRTQFEDLTEMDGEHLKVFNRKMTLDKIPFSSPPRFQVVYNYYPETLEKCVILPSTSSSPEHHLSDYITKSTPTTFQTPPSKYRKNFNKIVKILDPLANGCEDPEQSRNDLIQDKQSQESGFQSCGSDLLENSPSYFDFV